MSEGEQRFLNRSRAGEYQQNNLCAEMGQKPSGRSASSGKPDAGKIKEHGTVKSSRRLPAV